MSSVWYQFCSTQQSATCKSRSCDFCGLTLTRLAEAPRSERDRNEHAAEFPRGAFLGWSSFSCVLKVDEDGNNVDLHVDFCAGCTAVVWDRLLGDGVYDKFATRALEGHKTIYLDALGREVADPEELEPKQSCGWRGPATNPAYCHRVQGHEGACSPQYDEGMVECPACADWDGYRQLYTTRALENHAVNEHAVTYEEGIWRVTPPNGVVHEFQHVLPVLVLLQDVRRNPTDWRIHGSTD